MAGVAALPRCPNRVPIQFFSPRLDYPVKSQQNPCQSANQSDRAAELPASPSFPIQSPLWCGMSSYHDPQNRNRPPVGSAANGWLVIVLVTLVGVLMFRTVGETLRNRPNYTPRTVTARGELAADEKSTIEAFQLAAPSVVFIKTKGEQQFRIAGQFQEQELSSGSGFVWDESGHIVTNLHVVKDTLLRNETLLEVQLIDGTRLDAVLVGGVYAQDIAILRVDAKASQLQPITLGTSDDLQVGQRVMAIGNPFGFDHTLSTGVIGGLNRSVATGTEDEFLSGLIQTDAAINPGNSGGPLLDSAGRLIGVNTAIVSRTGESAGLGFAVPVAAVMEAVHTILEGASRTTSGELGVGLLDWDEAQQLRLPREIFDQGPIVRYVFPNTAAEEAGLRQLRIGYSRRGFPVLLGDQITSVDGVPVTTGAQLRELVQARRPGETVTLEVIREGQKIRLNVLLKAPRLLF
jgi:S1-C subfamily serine protease